MKAGMNEDPEGTRIFLAMLAEEEARLTVLANDFVAATARRDEALRTGGHLAGC